jgi:hypothetical protein
MPFATTVDHIARIVHATATGTISAPELQMFITTVRAGDLAPYGLLFDTRAAQLDPIGPDVWQIADEMTRVHPREHRGPVALVAAGGHTGLVRMYETLIDHINVAVRAFSDPAAAEEWLATRPGSKARGTRE